MVNYILQPIKSSSYVILLSLIPVCLICISLSCVLQNHQNQHTNGTNNVLREQDDVFQDDTTYMQ